MGRSAATYWPESFDTTRRDCPVSLLMAVTDTFGTAAAEGSVMVPTIVASCAKAWEANTPSSSTQRMARKLGLWLLTRTAKLRTNLVESRLMAFLQTSRSCANVYTR